MEQIAVVPRNVLSGQDWLGHGFRPLPEGLLDAVARHATFVARAPAEDNPTLKQIIPYVVFQRDGEFFVTERLAQGGEARLHGKLSMGIGGHVNPGEQDAEAGIVYAGMRREVEEEVVVSGAWDVHPIGTMNDDTTAVGAVHFGIVFLATVAPGVDIRVRETEKLTGCFRSRAWIAERADRLETWSALLLPHI